MVSGLQDLGRDHAPSLLEIAESAVGGLIAALAGTVILGIARLVRRWWARRRDVKYIRDMLIEGQTLVLGAEGTFNEHANATSSADSHRAAQYNNMIEKLRVALEKWAVNLSHNQRRDIFDALDWYHTDGLLAVRVKGEMQYVQVPRWKMVWKGHAARSKPRRNSRDFSPLNG